MAKITFDDSGEYYINIEVVRLQGDDWMLTEIVVTGHAPAKRAK